MKEGGGVGVIKECSGGKKRSEKVGGEGSKWMWR